jgi:hypothetical protein
MSGCREAMQIRILSGCFEGSNSDQCLVGRKVCSSEHCLICLKGMQFRTACFLEGMEVRTMFAFKKIVCLLGKYASHNKFATLSGCLEGSNSDQCLVVRKVCRRQQCLVVGDWSNSCVAHFVVIFEIIYCWRPLTKNCRC